MEKSSRITRGFNRPKLFHLHRKLIMGRALRLRSQIFDQSCLKALKTFSVNTNLPLRRCKACVAFAVRIFLHIRRCWNVCTVPSIRGWATDEWIWPSDCLKQRPFKYGFRNVARNFPSFWHFLLQICRICFLSPNFFVHLCCWVRYASNQYVCSRLRKSRKLTYAETSDWAFNLLCEQSRFEDTACLKGPSRLR